MHPFLLTGPAPSRPVQAAPMHSTHSGMSQEKGTSSEDLGGGDGEG